MDIGVGRFCPVCGATFEKLAPGPGGRRNASCPHCRSLERHRLLALLLQGAAPLLAGADILEVAPSAGTTPMLAGLGPRRHVRLDFDPGADGRAVDVQGSLTDLPFADDSFDFAVALHVFEHIPDDRSAMRELARVLRPGGTAVLQIPWWPTIVAGEDPSASPAERLRRFGQVDHVRSYGPEQFGDRLVEEGLEVLRFLSRDVADPDVVTALGLFPTEATWVVRPARTGTGAHLVAPPGLRQRVLSQVLEAGIDRERARLAADAEVARLREEITVLELTASSRVAALSRRVERADRATEQWKRRYERLRGRLPLRVAAAVARPVRRAVHGAAAGGGGRSGSGPVR